MDFQDNDTTRALQRQLQDFMDRMVLPHHRQWHDSAERGEHPTQLIDDLKALAKEEGLWNMFLPALRPDEPGTRRSNLEYAPLAEIMGRLYWSSEVFNCSAPDTGNMELLHLFATSAQREAWLLPLLHVARSLTAKSMLGKPLPQASIHQHCFRSPRIWRKCRSTPAWRKPTSAAFATPCRFALRSTHFRTVNSRARFAWCG